VIQANDEVEGARGAEAEANEVLKKAVAALQERQRDLITQAEEAYATRKASDMKVEELSKALAVALGEAEAAEAAKSSVEEQLSDATTAAKVAAEEVGQAEAAKQELDERVISLTAQYETDTQQRIAKQKEKMAAMRKDNSALQTKVEQLEGEQVQAQAQLQAQTQTQANSQAALAEGEAAQLAKQAAADQFKRVADERALELQAELQANLEEARAKSAQLEAELDRIRFASSTSESIAEAAEAAVEASKYEQHVQQAEAQAAAQEAEDAAAAREDALRKTARYRISELERYVEALESSKASDRTKVSQ